MVTALRQTSVHIIGRIRGETEFPSRVMYTLNQALHAHIEVSGEDHNVCLVTCAQQLIRMMAELIFRYM